ncbi:hypothetical protein SAMN05444143_101885 [Flavobacterium succinicans]|jgi:hypothetical protein|uniref:Concanavalin A-like lectin/glucanases superfamily protein n=1 Tax=Flavobacterium succinicans TaxID=29536 RepID=A0A1I4SLV4_9FLAO|nr:hypothetical protein [Flavobacterium succinicans]SFM65404.1 hypothetical protein SAMN05444143_101885 [Flavobacterium succinicans]
MKNIKPISLVTAAIASLFLLGCEDSIDKVNSPIPYVPVGGYENSDDIAKDHLVAKFSFDGNLNDSKNNISNVEGTKVNFTKGIKGNAYKGSSTEARYAIGTGTSKITSVNNHTISFWLNTANTVPDAGSPGQGKGAQGLFSIVRPTEFWGGLNVFLENPDKNFPNRLRLKLDIQNGRAGVVWRGQSIIMNIDDSLNKWIHVVLSYNATTSTISGYLNGAVVLAKLCYANNPGGPDNPNNAPKYGNFEMVGTNGKVVFGTHQFETTPPLNNGSDQPWATSFAGLMDEFRMYDSALTDNEVSALFKLEKDNR